MLKISIITVCKNAEDDIESTLLSVLAQSYENVEYVIIDGASEDNTLHVIEKYRDKISLFVSEKDEGVYDAMNKAISIASGEIIYFLNAGDSFINESVVGHVIDEFNKTGADMLYGNITTINKTTGTRGSFVYSNFDKIFLYKNTICHQAIFCKKSVFDRYGLFDTSFKIKADYDWILRCLFTNRIKAGYINLGIANNIDGGLSDKYYYKYSVKEIPVILKNHYGSFSRFILDHFVFNARMLFISRRLLKLKFVRYLLNNLMSTK